MFIATVLAGCGRVSFAPGAEAGIDAAVDAAEDKPDATPSDLVLYVPFESSNNDVAGGRTGSCTQCPVSVPSRQGLGNAVNFDASTCIEILDDDALRPAVFTYALWVRPRIAQTATVFSKPAMADVEDSNSYELWTQDTGMYVFSTNNGTQQQFTLAVGYTAGSWSHVAASFDGTTKRLYVNGVEKSSNVAVPSNYDADPVRIGCDREFGAEQHYFDGAVDEVRLYNRVLSSNEIATLAQ